MHAQVSTGPAVHARRPLLIVEDNRDLADTLALLLRNDGFDANVAYDGDQAIAMLTKCQFPAVICDIGLPGKSGYEVAAHVRRLYGRDSVIVAMSAYSTEGVREQARMAGFDGFFVKPVDPTELELFLQRHAAF